MPEAHIKRKSLVFLALIPLLVFTWLGFKNLSTQGILFHDIGMNLLEAKFVSEGMTMAAGILRSPGDTSKLWAQLKSETTGVPPHCGKPGDSLILWLASLPRGFHDTLSAEVGVTCGLLGLLLIFLIALRGNQPLREALYAVTILASSLLYFTLNRSAFADSVTLIFFLAGLLVYPRKSVSLITPIAQGRFLLTGLCFGMAFACTQWRAAFILGILLMLESVRTLLHKNWQTGFLRLLAIMTGFLIPMVLFQLPYVALKLRLGPLPFVDYWGQLHERLIQGRGLTWFQNSGQLFRTYWFLEAGVFPSLVFMGWLILAISWFKKKNFSDFLLLSFSIIPYGYFSVMTYSNVFLPRTTSLVIPVAALCAGSGLSRLQSFAEKKWPGLLRFSFLLTLGMVLMLTFQGARRQSLHGITRSGYPEASRYLASTGERQFLILGNEPLWRFYLGRAAYDPYNRPLNFRELIQAGETGKVERLVVDYETLHSRYGMDYTRALLTAVTPERIFENPRGRSLPYLLDDYGLEKSREIAADPAADKIYIFRVQDVRAALAAGRLG